MYQALYRTFRPDTFDDVLGQEHIVRILKNQLDRETVSHAYLFCGTRGTGKTSLARILAKGVNCQAPQGQRPCGICENCQAIRDGLLIDVIEIDAASNNGVDSIRELRESVQYPPAVGRRKVYIIDEVHMLTTPAFNALLKTLEEPPDHSMFILATTEAHKLPATILSRCLRLDFHRISEKAIKEGLNRISRALAVELTSEAAGLIVRSADGSVRDALSLLDQCLAASNGKVDRSIVLTFLGASSEEVLIDLTDAVIQGDAGAVLQKIDRILEEGRDARQLLRDWIDHYRNLLIARMLEKPGDMIDLSAENTEAIVRQSRGFNVETIRRHILELADAQADARWSVAPRVLVEICAIQMADSVAPVPKSVSEPARKEPVSEPKPKALVSKPEPVSESVPKKPAPKSISEAAITPDEPAEPAQEVVAAEILSSEDLDQLWQRLIDECDSLPGLIGIGCSLAEVGESNFVVATTSQFNKDLVEAHSQTLETEMEQLVGRRLRMVCQYHKEIKKEPTAQELAEMASRDLGGIDVKIT
jgi:DNA polymerase-3 subunit gamma/tau